MMKPLTVLHIPRALGAGTKPVVFSVAVAMLSIGAVQSLRAADLSPPKSVTSADPLTKARAAVERKDWTVAIRDLDDLLKREPKNADAHSLLGFSLRNNGDYKNSKIQYDEALRIDPDHKGANEYLGELYLKLKQPENAQKHLAVLERVCGKNCEEYEDLAKAIADYGK